MVVRHFRQQVILPKRSTRWLTPYNDYMFCLRKIQGVILPNYKRRNPRLPWASNRAVLDWRRAQILMMVTAYHLPGKLALYGVSLLEIFIPVCFFRGKK